MGRRPAYGCPWLLPAQREPDWELETCFRRRGHSIDGLGDCSVSINDYATSADDAHRRSPMDSRGTSLWLGRCSISATTQPAVSRRGPSLRHQHHYSIALMRSAGMCRYSSAGERSSSLAGEFCLANARASRSSLLPLLRFHSPGAGPGAT